MTKDFVPASTIPAAIREQARYRPEAIAVRDARSSLTFAALDRASDRVAEDLLARGPQEAVPVALLMDVGIPGAAAALGVLKSGRPYVALDTTLPPALLSAMLTDCGSRVILCGPDLLRLAQTLADGRAVLEVGQSALTQGEPQSLAITRDAIARDGLALLTYTSGTTGRPKAVVQTHASAHAQAVRYARAYQIGPGDCLAGSTALAAAGSFWDIFGPLCLGACAGLFDTRRLGLSALPDWLVASEATVLSGLPLARQLYSEFGDRQFPRVRMVQLGGDTVYQRDVEQVRRLCPNAVIAVGFGLSEAGRVAEQFITQDSVLSHEVVPIGLPVPGVRLLLLSDSGEPVPPGTPGEIVVQSRDLARGYWRRPELTAARFRTDLRHGPDPLYATGDLARMLPNGHLQHLGRADHLVKIRGSLVPPGEVEGALLQVGDVREACVVVQSSQDRDPRVVAYLVRDQDSQADAASILDRLRTRLPEHMVPARIVFVDRLPRNANGKVDRRALPDVGDERPALATPFVAPRDDKERAVASIWADVLGLGAIGIHDRFLDLGGNSLYAMRIANRVVQQMDVAMLPSALFVAPTVADMAALVRDARQQG